jgi:1,4-alpha-glucan branching enzyme
MKKQFVLFIALFSMSVAQAFNVTFSVEMAGAPAFTTPYVSGGFNGWCGNCNPMTDANTDGIWEATIDIPAGPFEYKFTADDWFSQEFLTPGSSCTVTNSGFTNRAYTVVGDVVLPQVCWQLCTTCSAGPSTYPVTFRVDMSQQTGFTIPEVNGNFNGWCGNCSPMTDADMDGIWEATINLAAGNYEYKYSWGAWAGQETLVPGSSCTVTNSGFTNRTLVVGTDPITLPVVCYGFCTDCASVLPYYNVTFRVDMNQQSGFTTPEVNGTFNGWCGSCSAMADVNADGVWEITIPLQAGNYLYKYSWGAWSGQENLTPGSACTATDGPNTNRTLTVGPADMTLPVVCYGSCSACALITYPITFKVDMNNETGFTIPEVNGSFNGWCGNCNAMTDANADGVWEVTLNLAPGSYEYKYSWGSWTGEEALTPGSSCTVTNSGFTNRTLTVGNEAQVLSAVCYNTCAACSAPTYPITFRVDMNNETGFTIPEVNGTFNGWCGGCAAMTDANSDGVWDITINLAAGTYEFKYAHDSWAGAESLTPGSPCTVTNFGFTNRTLTVTNAAQVMPVVCYSSCSTCAAPPANITFRVNMAEQFGFTTPELNGSFNGWCGNCTQMTDANNDGIWQVTVALMPGTYEYKFSHDTWSGEENLTPGSPCTMTTSGFTNRVLTVGSSNQVLDVVCWNSCSSCAPLVVVNDNVSKAKNVPISGSAYPLNNCFNSTLVGATVSLQGNPANVQAGGGQDVWYKIVAPTSALRVTTTTSAIDIVLELRSSAMTQVDMANSVAGIGGETMTTSGLTPGATYYIAIRSFDGAVGTFSVCIQTFTESFCSDGSGIYNLCSSFKPKWVGANSYVFNFTPVMGTPGSPTSASSTGQIPLSTPALNLRYGGVYDVTVDVVFNLPEGEIVTLPGTSVCTVTIADHASVEVKTSQRCPATLLKGSMLQGKPYVCGAINFTVEFTPMSDCAGTTATGLQFEATTLGSSSNIVLSTVPGITNNTYYLVRFRPNFAYGPGNGGIARIIFVGGSALDENIVEANLDSEKNDMVEVEASLYPNPSTGDMINLNITNVTSNEVFVRVMDSMGKLVYTNRFSVEGSLNTVIVFNEKLANGLYLVEFVDGNNVINEKLIVE